MRIAIALSVLLFQAPAPEPSAPDTELIEAARLQEEGRHTEAREIYRGILAQRPNHPGALSGAALAALVAGDMAEAEALGARRLAMPERAPSGVYVLVASARALQGSRDGALETIRAGKAVWPGDETIRHQGGLLLIALGRYDEAIEDFSYCLKRSPYRADYWRAIGDALVADGAKGKAFAAYARALTLDGSRDEAKDVAREMWDLLFDAVREERSFTTIAPPSASQSDERYRGAAEAMGMALVAALRQDDDWRERSDAAFFAYALDTILKLVSALHEDERGDGFWRPFLFAYFDELRAAGHVEALAYDIRRAAEDPEAVAWGRSNREKLVRFRDWSERWAVDWRPQGNDGR